MRELSLNVMDIAQNSLVAGASLITIIVCEDDASLTITIEDNGKGMDAETLERVQSPFYTTRTTRSVGLGIPLYKMACEMTGGSLELSSELGVGTKLKALFFKKHIDMVPLGDISQTVQLLVTCNPDVDFVYTRTLCNCSYTMDTREMREILGEDVPLSSPDVSLWLKEYLAEQDAELKHRMYDMI